jgi:hypothetical protein
MSNVNIVEGNKKIASFDGYVEIFGEWEKKTGPATISVIFESQMNYHYDWKMLMNIVAKIERFHNGISLSIDTIPHDRLKSPIRFCHTCTIRGDFRTSNDISIRESSFENKITAIWKAVISFIDWYNAKVSVPES